MAKHVPTIAKPDTAWLNILVYGRPGVGKTTFAAGANDHPAMKDALFLSVEGGLLSVAGRGDIFKVELSNPTELEEVFWDFIKKDEAYARFKTVVLDSGTEIQNSGLEDIVRRNIMSPENQGKPESKRRDDLDRFYLEDYGKSNAQLTRMFRWFRDAPMHFIMTALPKPVYPKGNSENVEPVEVIPSFTAKLAESAQGFMDFVWYMYLDGEGKRWILTRDRLPYRAKTRGPRFAEAIGERVEDPSLPKLYETFLQTEGVAVPASKAKAS